ncbi:GGDEF domain-containing protein [Aquipuribacter sp. SD81]|uniref:GGDEF domain-containing protein n=1 Tax=Aquipuribacter sp. SD81 TaxID=3127703 RepID=UPI00301AB209
MRGDPVLRTVRVLVLVLWPTVAVWLLPGQHRDGPGLVLAAVTLAVFSLAALLLLLSGSHVHRVVPACLTLFSAAAVVGALAGTEPEMALLVPLFLGVLSTVAAARLGRRGTWWQIAVSAVGSLVCVAYVADDPVKTLGASVAVVAGVAAPAVAILRVRTQLDAAHARERRLALTDSLTGALNRRGLFEGLDEVCDAAADAVVVVALDLDGFKHLNDTFGHAVGDDVLVGLVRELHALGRQPVSGRPLLVARLGGEEFLVVAPSTGVPTALLAECVRSATVAVRLPDGSRPTVSVGAVEALPPAAVEDRRAWLLRRMDEADRLMYEAKRSGGDRSLVG